jgi:hypothetical protein
LGLLGDGDGCRIKVCLSIFGWFAPSPKVPRLGSPPIPVLLSIEIQLAPAAKKQELIPDEKTIDGTISGTFESD